MKTSVKQSGNCRLRACFSVNASRSRCSAIRTVAFMPGALNRFVFIKVAIVAVGVALAFTVPERGRLSTRRKLRFSQSGRSFFSWPPCASKTLRAPAFVGLAPRYEGVLFSRYMSGLPPPAPAFSSPNRAAGSTTWFMQWLAVAAVLVAVEAALEMAGLRPLVTDVRSSRSLLETRATKARGRTRSWSSGGGGCTDRRWPYIVGTSPQC